MNGPIQDDNRVPAQVAGSAEQKELQSIVRHATRDHKVIFGAHRGVFDVNRPDIENFLLLLNQRVREQNGVMPLSCEAAVYYDNGTSRRFPSIEDFNAYTETSQRFPTVLTLHAVYLIEFPDSEEPEKQEIDIVIRASESTSDVIDMVQDDSRLRMASDKIQMGIQENPRSNLGIITYTINHSRVTWGLDLEAHIRGHVERLLVEPSKTDRFFRRSPDRLI